MGIDKIFTVQNVDFGFSLKKIITTITKQQEAAPMNRPTDLKLYNRVDTNV